MIISGQLLTKVGGPIQWATITFDPSIGDSISFGTDFEGKYSCNVPVGNYRVYKKEKYGIDIELLGENVAVDATGTISLEGLLDRNTVPAYTAATLPDPATLGAGAAVVVDGQELAVSEGIWQGKRRSVFVKTGLESDSAFNTQQIQTALNLGGIVEIIGEPGKVYVDKSVNTVACLVHPSFTTLVVPDNIRITQKGGQSVPIIMTKAVADYKNNLHSTVSLSWSSGVDFTVNYQSNHGLVVGDYVSVYKESISNTDSIQFAGTFRVNAVPSLTSVSLRLYRSGVSVPSGQWKACKSTVLAKLYGGGWDFNTANNPSLGINKMALIYGFTAKNLVSPAALYNTQKYCIMLACDYGSRIDECFAPAAGSDGVKIYGPAESSSVGRIHGSYGDDLISLQPYEAEAYASYRLSFGDIQNITIDIVNGTSSSSPAVVYTDTLSGAIVDNIKFGFISGIKACRVTGQESLQGNAGLIDFGVIKPYAGCDNALQLNNCKVETVKAVIRGKPSQVPNGFIFDATSKVGTANITLDVDDANYTSATQWGTANGQCDVLNINGRYITGNVATRMILGPSIAASYLKSVRFTDLYAKNVSWLLRVLSGPTATTCVTIRDSVLQGVHHAVEVNSTTQTARVRAGSNEADALTGGFLQLSAGVNVQFLDAGGNYLTGGSILTNANGGTISAWS